MNNNKETCCSILCQNLGFLGAQVKAKFHDDLLIGTERSRKIIPDCETPNPHAAVLAWSLTLAVPIMFVSSNDNRGPYSHTKSSVTGNICGDVMHVPGIKSISG